MLGLCVLSFVRSNHITSIKSATALIKDDAETTISYNVVETDYYSDVNEEYEKKTESIRILEKKIILGVYAISCIGSLVLVIILVHLKSRKASRLTHLT